MQLARVEEIFARHGEHFVRRLLMPQEEAAFRAYRRPVRFLAMRFAAKEAIVKALGTGFAHGIWVRDVGISQNAWGRPEVIWSERGRELRDLKDYRQNIVNNLDVLTAIQNLGNVERAYVQATYATKRFYWQLLVAAGEIGREGK